MSEHPVISWTEAGESRSARWRSEAAMPPPKRVMIADDTLAADAAYKLACEGTGLLWRGDFQNARQMLQALARRIDRKQKARKPAPTPLDAFHAQRQAQAQRVRILSMVLLPFEADYTIPLRRAPDARQACNEAYGSSGGEASVATLRELLGLIGAHEWRKKGVEIAVLDGQRIHPHYGVFSPVRGEYLDLVAQAPLPSRALAFDIGTGTGVLAAILAQRGVARIVATDQEPRALRCARENLDRQDLTDRVELLEADLFPPGKAPLIVCNPPWLPARPSSPLEHAIYDPESRMLLGFLNGLAEHLTPGGEGWLIMSDLAEHIGLRGKDDLMDAFAAAGLRVAGKSDIKPRHPRVGDASDPLHAARAAEVTSLWRLVPK